MWHRYCTPPTLLCFPSNTTLKSNHLLLRTLTLTCRRKKRSPKDILVQVPSSPIPGKKLKNQSKHRLHLIQGVTVEHNRRVVKHPLTHHQAHQKEKNALAKKGKRLKTMLAVQEEADEGQILLSSPTASRKTAAHSPMVATAAGTLII